MSEDLDDIVENLREPSAWIRVLFMVGFALVLHLIVGPIIIVLMIVQALFKLITGETNFNLRRFGRALGQWVYEVIQFLTYNSQEKPFPFSDFPPLEDEEEADEGKESKRKKANRKAAKDETGDTSKAQDSETTGSSARKKPAAKKSASKKKSGNSSSKKKTAAKKSSSKKADSKDAGKDDSGDKAQDDKAGDDKSEA